MEMTQTLKAILESEGLTGHFEKFDERGITDSILDEITDSDLRDFGISKLGERKRLLAAFRDADGFQSAAIPAPVGGEDIPSAEVPEPLPEPEPEPPDVVPEITAPPEESPATPARASKPRTSRPKPAKKTSRHAAGPLKPDPPAEAPKRAKPARRKKSPPPLEVEEPAPAEPAPEAEAEPPAKSMVSALIWVVIFGPFGLLYVSFMRTAVFTLIFLVGAVFAHGNLLGLLAVWMLAPVASILLFGVGRR